MLPPRQHDADLAAGEQLAVGEHGGEAGGARAFDHGLFDLQQQRHRALKLRLVDQHEIVEQAGKDLRGELARLLDRDALGQRVAADTAGSSPLSTLYIDGYSSASTPISPMSGLMRAGDWCPCRRPARRRRPGSPACRARHILEHLQRHGALTGGDMRIVERMDEGQPQLLLQPAGVFEASSKLSPSSTTLPPTLSVCMTFTVGVVLGMTIVTGTPSRVPW